MNKDLSKVPILLVLFQYKLGEFFYNQFEIPQFEPLCEVVIYDLSLLTNPKWAQALSYDRSARSNVITIATWTSFFRHVSDLANIAATRPISIRHFLPNSAAEMMITACVSLTFLRRGAKQFYMHNGGLPIPRTSIETNPTNTRDPILIARFQSFLAHVSSLSELKTRVNFSINRYLARIFSGPITHQLAAGEHYVQEALRLQNKRTKLVFGHSDDYSKYVRSIQHTPKQASHTTNLAVMLDDNEPHSVGDYSRMHRPSELTAAKWFPAITKLFDQLESQTGVSIAIAGHYKSQLPPIAACFGNRPVHHGKTLELISNCKYAITRSSTATSYAVILRKPVIFIYSDELEADGLQMQWTFYMAGFLGTQPININRLPSDLTTLLTVNEERYKAYEKACLTSAGPSRTNAQIILEDIMGISTTPSHLTPET